MRKTKGPTAFIDILRTSGKTPVARALDAARATRALSGALKAKGLPDYFARAASVTVSEAGVSVHASSAAVASKLRQLAPSLNDALGRAGIGLSLADVRADKTAFAPDGPEPEGPPRTAGGEASEAVRAQARETRDEKVRQALERLAEALEP